MLPILRVCLGIKLSDGYQLVPLDHAFRLMANSAFASRGYRGTIAMGNRESRKGEKE